MQRALVDAGALEHRAVYQFFASPDLKTNVLAGELRCFGDAGLLERKKNERVFPINSCERHPRHTLAAGDENLIGAGDAELLTAARHHLDCWEIRAAGLDRDIETGSGIIALLLGYIVSGELRLVEPFEPHRDGFSGWRERRRKEQAEAQ